MFLVRTLKSHIRAKYTVHASKYKVYPFYAICSPFKILVSTDYTSIQIDMVNEYNNFLWQQRKNEFVKHHLHRKQVSLLVYDKNYLIMFNTLR